MEQPVPRRPKPMRFEFPADEDPAAVRARVVMMENLLERCFTVPGLNMSIGLDAIIGLVPVIGDVVSAMLGAYIVWEARNLGLPRWKLVRMGANVLLDTAIGVIPVVGDAADFLFRSNTKNLRILRRHLDKHHPEARVIEG
jgi:hypothetical protein